MRLAAFILSLCDCRCKQKDLKLHAASGLRPTLTGALQQNLSVAQPPNVGLVVLPSGYHHAVCHGIQTHTKHRAWPKKDGLMSSTDRICLLLRSVESRQGVTSVFGEGELAVILVLFHLVLGFPAFVIVSVSAVFKVNILQVISQVVLVREKDQITIGNKIHLC